MGKAAGGKGACTCKWAGLLAAPESSPIALKAHAEAFLKARGLVPGVGNNSQLDIDLLHDQVDDQRARYANGDEGVYRDAEPVDYLSPVELEAGRRLHGTRRPTIEKALELHLSLHTKRDNKTFVTYLRRAFSALTAITGDRDMAAFGREDARLYVQRELLAGVKTGTVSRRLRALSAVFTTWRLERDPHTTNPFEKLSIPGEGVDKKARVSFSKDELLTLAATCRAKDDDLRWIVALLADIGAQQAN